MSKLLFRCLPIFGISLLALASSDATPEPPSPDELAARAELMGALYPGDDVAPEDFRAGLEAARKAGASEQRLLEAEVFRVFNKRIRHADFDRLAERLERAADSWAPADAVVIDAPELAKALAKLLKARKARLAGDVDAFRGYAAEALWLVPNLQYLVDDLDAEVRRDALVGHPDFAAFNRACAEGNEAAVKRFFARAYWADAPVSQELALERLEAFRVAREQPVGLMPGAAWQKPPRGVMAFGRARRATSPLLPL